MKSLSSRERRHRKGTKYHEYRAKVADDVDDEEDDTVLASHREVASTSITWDRRVL